MANVQELQTAIGEMLIARRNAAYRKRDVGDPRNPFRAKAGRESEFYKAAQSVRAYDLILKLLEKEAARKCMRRAVPTLDAILDFVIGFGLLALGMLDVAAACVAAGAPDAITRTAALLGVGFIMALSLHRLARK